AALTGREIGDPIGPVDLARLLTHDEGGRKRVPPGARFYPVLTRLDEGNREAARRVGEWIEALGGADGVIFSTRSTEPAAIRYLAG
ncbi:MAG TPA: hypothetical protein VHL09_11075, partial [Dehalococcoidia bacterium]|nr:hypothetical protein [Dehalococcoidia bacterium]